MAAHAPILNLGGSQANKCTKGQIRMDNGQDSGLGCARPETLLHFGGPLKGVWFPLGLGKSQWTNKKTTPVPDVNQNAP